MQSIILKDMTINVYKIHKIIKRNENDGITIFYSFAGTKDLTILRTKNNFIDKAYNYLAKNSDKKKIDLRRFQV